MNESLGYCSGIETDASDGLLASISSILQDKPSMYNTVDDACTRVPGDQHDTCINEQLKLLCTALNSANVPSFLVSRAVWTRENNRLPSIENQPFRSAEFTNLVKNDKKMILEDVQGASYCTLDGSPVPKQCMSTCVEVVLGTSAPTLSMLTSEIDSRFMPLNICFNPYVFVPDFTRDDVPCSGRSRQYRNVVQFTWSCVNTNSQRCMSMKQWSVEDDTEVCTLTPNP
jgi:hypothetical protein